MNANLQTLTPFKSSTKGTISNLKPVFKKSANFEATWISTTFWLDSYFLKNESLQKQLQNLKNVREKSWFFVKILLNDNIQCCTYDNIMSSIPIWLITIPGSTLNRLDKRMKRGKHVDLIPSGTEAWSLFDWLLAFFFLGHYSTFLL